MSTETQYEHKPHITQDRFFEYYQFDENAENRSLVKLHLNLQNEAYLQHREKICQILNELNAKHSGLEERPILWGFGSQLPPDQKAVKSLAVDQQYLQYWEAVAQGKKEDALAIAQKIDFSTLGKLKQKYHGAYLTTDNLAAQVYINRFRTLIKRHSAKNRKQITLYLCEPITGQGKHLLNENEQRRQDKLVVLLKELNGKLHDLHITAGVCSKKDSLINPFISYHEKMALRDNATNSRHSYSLPQKLHKHSKLLENLEQNLSSASSGSEAKKTASEDFSDMTRVSFFKAAASVINNFAFTEKTTTRARNAQGALIAAAMVTKYVIIPACVVYAAFAITDRIKGSDYISTFHE